MKTLNVDLADRSYPIYIGSKLLEKPQLITNHVLGNSAVIVSNSTVAPLYIEYVQSALNAKNIRFDEVILPDGEEYKTLQTVVTIIDTLLSKKHDRKTTIIALGGGVVGDIAGFAASIYQRGVNFIQIPTTLLSQVDSSVGGKTGVNHSLGKNMIGAFYQPQCVIADTDTLKTLDSRQLSAGLAEVIKYGFIHDANFFSWLEKNIELLMAKDPATLVHSILVSCQVKADIVAIDEKESGLRAILNFGHTFGHAIEASMGYGNWLHGEAVAAGMIMAIDLSQREGWVNNLVRQRAEALFKKCSLPVLPPAEMTIEKYMNAMSIDKKVIDGSIKLILLKTLGKAVITEDFSADNLNQTLTTM